MSDFIEVACASDLPVGRARAVTVGGRTVALYHTARGFFATDNVCPHRGGPLAEGFVQDGCLYCPWHGWGFNLETGNYVGAPGIGVRTHAVEVKDGSVMVKLG